MGQDEKIIYYPFLPEPDEIGAERSDHVLGWIEKYLKPAGLIAEKEEDANAYLVATGDGGMTRAARSKCETGKILFGLNCGTLGFLMNNIIDWQEIPKSFKELNLVSVSLMKGEFFFKKNKKSVSYYAFNDIFCGGNIADYIDFEIKGTLSHFRDRNVKGNGIFVSTPQGTTGFALNARGSAAVLPLDTNTWYVGGVATGPYPNNLATRQKITIHVNSRTPVHGYADGYAQEAKDIKKIIVTPNDHSVTLGFLKHVDFESRRRELAHNVEIGNS